MEQITWYGEYEMGFDIKPGMSTWNNTTSKYKKEYYIYTAKMERRKFENDRKIREKIKLKRSKISIGLSKKATMEEKKWFGWML